MLAVVGSVHGSDTRGRLLRRTMMRYGSLAAVLGALGWGYWEHWEHWED
uniref:Uncharacterized protein n=1 Tax=Melopsittacus undulatus TaxID=13146 RepID=A0A8V5GUR3_MELUD